MHHGLGMPDIVANIFENIHHDGDVKTLASLARTCSTFQEPALDLLWRKLESLIPLMKVMPDDLWTLEEEDYRYVLQFVRPMNGSDWLRLEYYGHKILELETQFGAMQGLQRRQEKKIQIHKDVFAALVSYQPARRLFPRLRCVSVRCWSCGISGQLDALPFFQALLGPSLVSVHLAWQPMRSIEAAAHLSSFLHSILRTSRHIRHLTINNTPRPEMVTALNEVISNLENLETLSAKSTPVQRDVLHHLGRLKTFVCWGGAIFPLDIQALRIAGGLFPYLRQFSFTAPHALAATQVVNLMACPFEQLSIFCGQPEGPTTHPLSYLTLLAEAFPNHRSVHTLSHIRIEIQDRIDIAGQSVTAALSPLFSLRSLEEIRFSSNVVVELDDGWLEEASKSWPLLKGFHVFCPEPLGRTQTFVIPAMTMAGLIPIVKRCHRLTELTVTLTASAFDPLLLRDADQVGPEGRIMDFVNFRCCVMGSMPTEVFRCLTLIFPVLGAFWCSGFRRDDDRGWRELSGMVEVILATDSLA